MTRAVGILLAAGRSARTGFPKALAEIDGVTFVARALATLRDAGVPDIVVVVAPPHGAAIASRLENVRIAENPAPERGMLSSLQVGLSAALSAWPDAELALFALVDHPRVRAETVARLISEWRARGAGALRPTHGGHGGHPVIISRELCDRLERADVTTTIRDVIAAELVDVEVDDAAVIEDADTREALRALGAREPRE